MTPERYKQIDELVDAALSLPQVERACYLDAACDGDEELRREVESVLAHHEQASRLLESPAIERAAELIAGPESRSLEGETISHYTLIRRIGSGGMGKVYLAEDTRLDRRVAIKILPPESVAGERARKRLAREARAAAKLDHPNICPIYEVAEDDSRSFIVMQYSEI